MMAQIIMRLLLPRNKMQFVDSRVRLLYLNLLIFFMGEILLQF